MDFKRIKDMKMKCERCNGKKEIYQKNPDCETSCNLTEENCEGFGKEYCCISSTCPACNGTGEKESHENCKYYKRSTKTIELIMGSYTENIQKCFANPTPVTIEPNTPICRHYKYKETK